MWREPRGGKEWNEGKHSDVLGQGNIVGSMTIAPITKAFYLDVSSYNYIHSQPLGNFVERSTHQRGLLWWDQKQKSGDFLSYT